VPAPRPFALIRTFEQWLRVSHENTALNGEVVRLFWEDDAEQKHDEIPFEIAGDGLAFDSHCRLYHSVPDEGRIERLLWANLDPLGPATSQATPVDLVTGDDEAEFGDFSSVKGPPQRLIQPARLAVDDEDRLFVIESGMKRILVFDLWSRRFLGGVNLAMEPIDLVAEGRKVHVLLKTPPGLVRINARGNVETREWPAVITDPSRIALCPNGDLFILEHAGTAQARVINYARSSEVISVPFATDIEFQTYDPIFAEVCSGENHVLVAARRPGEPFRRSCVGTGDAPPELPPLTARGYDGRGIVRVPDGRIGF
jgi:hypothetical protein